MGILKSITVSLQSTESYSCEHPVDDSKATMELARIGINEHLSKLIEATKQPLPVKREPEEQEEGGGGGEAEDSE